MKIQVLSKKATIFSSNTAIVWRLQSPSPAQDVAGKFLVALLQKEMKLEIDNLIKGHIFTIDLNIAA